MPWGSDTNNESKPDWGYLTVRGRANSAPKSANVFATGSGWVHRWPWGDEVLVAIGGLSTNLGNASLASIEALANGVTVNAAAQTMSLLASFNEAVVVTGSPTVLAIAATSNGVANVTLTYDASVSAPTAGKLVFRNTNVNLAAAGVLATFTVNASSVLAGWAGITDVNTNPVVNAISAGMSAVFTVGAA